MDSRYEKALSFESRGRFRDAFALFKNLLDSADIPDRGDLLFHCGWCQEHERSPDNPAPYEYYLQAADETALPVCRMNSLFRAGWLKMEEKNYPRAAEHYSQAVALHKREAVHDGLYSDAAYWLAVCLEGMGRYLEALKWYRTVQQTTPPLIPESRFREIQCLNRIGAYREALEVCRTFESKAPRGFDPDRYREIRSMAANEQKILEVCLSDDY